MIESSILSIVVGTAFGIIGLFFIAPLYAIYNIVFRTSKKVRNNYYAMPESAHTQGERDRMKELIDKLLNTPCEEVYTRSKEGLILTGRYYHNSDGAPLDLVFHGYHGTGVRDMCGYAELSIENGHNPLIVDQRAHGNSQGKYLTFGHKEREDCKRWVEYAVSRFGKDVKILLGGVSMGASTILMACELGLPDNVKGIIADSPYSSPREVICSVLKSKGMPVKVAYQVIAFSAMVFGRISLPTVTASQAVKKCNIPILIIHGEEDGFVPCQMSKPIAEAREGIERHTFAGADHAMSCLVDTKRYKSIVRDFMQRNVNK